MSTALQVLGRRRGWWRVWVLATVIWILFIAAVAIPASSWSDRINAATLRQFEAGPLEGGYGLQRVHCFDSTVEVAEVPPLQVNRYASSDERQATPASWREAPAVERDGPWTRFAQAQQMYDVSCTRWAPAAWGFILAFGMPLLVLLLAAATRWVLRGFAIPA